MQPICNQVFYRRRVAEKELKKGATNALISNSVCKAYMTALIL